MTETKKHYLVAQEFIVHGTHYYSIRARTMGEALKCIEEDDDLLPMDTEIVNVQILSYTEAEDNYDC